MTSVAYAPRVDDCGCEELSDADLRCGLTQGADQSGDGLLAVALLWALYHGGERAS